LFGEVEPVWKVVGQAAGAAEPEPLPGAPAATLQEIAEAHDAAAGRLSLVKLDAGGLEPAILQQEFAFLASARPILWAEARSLTADDEAAWDRFLDEGAAAWPYMIAFDDSGFACFAGKTAKKRTTFRDLLSYIRRHAALPEEQFGRASIQHLDLALFPERFGAVFEAFQNELTELADA
jgi:hypothetical protein